MLPSVIFCMSQKGCDGTYRIPKGMYIPSEESLTLSWTVVECNKCGDRREFKVTHRCPSCGKEVV